MMSSSEPEGLGMTTHNPLYQEKKKDGDGGKTKDVDDEDTRKPHDILLDYLVNLNAKPPPGYESGADFEEYLEKVGLNDLAKERKKEDEVDRYSICVYDEGFGGNGGFPKEYWKMRGRGKTPDTTAFYHYNEKVRRFFDLGGYRAFPEVITIQLEIREVFAVDLVRGTYRVSFVVTTRWYDRFFDREEFLDEEEMYAQSKPYITFEHVDEGDSPMGVPLDAAALTTEVKHSSKVQHKPADPPGVLYHSQRIQASFRVQNHLQKFPFDVQHLPLVIRLWGSSVKGNKDFGRVMLPLTMNMALAHNHLEWYPYQATSYVNKGRLDRQELAMCITLRRIPTFFIWNVYVILFLMPAISFFAFAMPPGLSDEGGPADFVQCYEGRCQITLTLMLTSVAYKFYLGEMLPKAPYLSRMDAYINVSFLTILTIFTANSIVLVIQFYQDADDTWANLDGRTSIAQTSVAASVDKIFAWLIFTVFSLINILQLYLANKDCGALEHDSRLRSASDDDKEDLGLKDKKKKLIEDFKRNIRSKKRLTSSEMQLIKHVKDVADRKSAFKKKINAEHAKDVASQEGKMNAPKESQKHTNAIFPTHTVHLRRAKYIELQLELERDGKKYLALTPKKKAPSQERTSTMEPQQQLETLCDSAGIPPQKVSSLCRQFASQSIDRDDLERIFNDGKGADAVSDMLKEIEVPLDARVKLLAVLSKPKSLEAAPFTDGLCAMQGSSSYLMIALELAGKLIKTDDLVARLKLELVTRMQQPNKEWDLNDSANMLLASALFSSPMLKSKYVYSQRTFNSKDDADTIEQVKKNVTKSVKKWTIPSQVWLGYLDKSNDWSVKDSTGALAVDIGTGKMAFGYAEKVQQPPAPDRIRAIDLSSHQADEDVVMKFFKDLVAMAQYLDVGFEANDYPRRGTPDEIEAWKQRHSESDADRLVKLCQPIADQLIAVRTYLSEQAGVELTGKEPIFFFGTAKLRLWVKEHELVHGGRCTELIHGLGNFIGELLNAKLKTGHVVKFEVVDQTYEAECELRAFELALKHGELEETDAANRETIVDLLEADKVGNIAWGNGSMQGHPDAKTYVCAEMGMNVAKEQIKAVADIKKNAKGKAIFSFDDAPAAEAAIEKARRTLVDKMAELAPRLPVPNVQSINDAPGFAEDI